MDKQNINLSTIIKDVDRVYAIVINERKVLLMHRRNSGKEYYTFSGGGIEKGETAEEALVRELMEETSVKVSPTKLLYDVNWDNESKEYGYLCAYISGVPKLADNSVEMETMKNNPEQYYNPLWMPLKNVPELLLYPLEVKDIFLQNIKDNFKSGLKKISLQRATARQKMQSLMK